VTAAENYPAPGVISRLLGNEAVLFCEPSGELFRLNTSGAYIWTCVEDGLAPEQIAAELAEGFGIAHDRALADVHRALSGWRHSGLLGDVPRRTASTAGASEKELQPQPPNAAAVGDNLLTVRRRFVLLGTRFLIRTGIALEATTHQLFGHLPAGSESEAQVQLDAVPRHGGYVVTKNGAVVAECRSATEVAPVLNTHSLLSAYSRIDCLTVLHAAVVARNGRCVLLPAAAGSGKSTLAAALAARGFVFFSDEVAPITRGTHRVLPVPSCIGLKSGAWPVLTPLFPSLATLPVHDRQDGKRVKYLPPPSNSLPTDLDRSLRVHAIMMPHFTGRGHTQLKRLSPAETLCRIATAGYDVNGPLDTARVDELLAWIANLDAYELSIATLEDAIRQVEKIAE